MLKKDPENIKQEKRPSKELSWGRGITGVILGFLVYLGFQNYEYFFKTQAPIVEPLNYSSLFTSKKDGFSVNFPNKPQISSGNLLIYDEKIPYTSYLAYDAHQREYVVSVSKHELLLSLARPEKEVFEKAVQGMRSGFPESTTLESNYATFQDHPAIFSHLKIRGDVYLKSIHVIVRDKLYIIMSNDYDQNVPEFQEFVDSFSLES